MEDPWASGSGWGQTPKKQAPTALPISTSPIRSPPPAASDPWSAPTPDDDPKPEEMPTFSWSASPVKSDTNEASTDTPGWGGGWEESPKAGPSRSPVCRPADSPEWSMSPRNEDDEPVRISMPEMKLEKSPPITLAPPIESPPSPGGFAESTPPQSPKYAIPDLGSFDEPPQTHSPTIGDDFGGFSSFGDDPWGNRKKEEGWGASSDHRSESTQEASRADDEGSGEEEDGWGASHSMDRRETSAVTSSGMDQDWEEAQKRIQVTELRAVSIVIMETGVTTDESAAREGRESSRWLAGTSERCHWRSPASRLAGGRGRSV